MKALVTGSNGLVGSAAVKALLEEGYTVHGIDNNMREELFEDAEKQSPKNNVKIEKYISHNFDLRNRQKIYELFQNLGQDGLEVVVHCAAQPSHDWATNNAHVDFELNAEVTLNICEAIRNNCSDTLMIHLSTNKVYGDTPNRLELIELKNRYDLEQSHKYYEGINEHMSIDNSLHSLFGVSKLTADLYVQEYSRQFSIPSVVLRGGCLTGPKHRGAMLHGFMNYLIRCGINKKGYNILGYKGKQVRDNLHADDIGDLIKKITTKHHNKSQIKYPVVANMGGGRANSISIIELIDKLKEDYSIAVNYKLEGTARTGDHIWYISDNSKLKILYDWEPKKTIDDIINETVKNIIDI